MISVYEEFYDTLLAILPAIRWSLLPFTIYQLYARLLGVNR